MKQIILDTDIGIDCDDMIALAMLLNLQKKGECALRAITLSTARRGAAAAVRAVCEYYGAPCPPIGQYRGEPLKADYRNTYAAAVCERFGCNDDADDAVSLLRKTLSSVTEKCLFVAIGPQCNLASLMRSQPDAVCALSGMELIREKVERVYIMGGCFDGSLPCAEFNIEQDIPSAICVGSECPVECVYLPFEAAADILTGKGTLLEQNSPVGLSVRLLFQVEFPALTEESMERSSWDPVTALLAVRGFGEYACRVKRGSVEVTPDGATRFCEKEGGKALLVTGLEKEKIKNDIDGLCVIG